MYKAVTLGSTGDFETPIRNHERLFEDLPREQTTRQSYWRFKKTKLYGQNRAAGTKEPALTPLHRRSPEHSWSTPYVWAPNTSLRRLWSMHLQPTAKLFPLYTDPRSMGAGSCCTLQSI